MQAGYKNRQRRNCLATRKYLPLLRRITVLAVQGKSRFETGR
jgi:hypothetical protein